MVKKKPKCSRCKVPMNNCYCSKDHSNATIMKKKASSQPLWKDDLGIWDDIGFLWRKGRK